MKIDSLALAGTLAFALSLPAATAQTSVTVPVAAASAPRTAKPSPRPLTPAELRESASSPADERPAGAVTPQISIPLGKHPPAPSMPFSRAARRSAAASSVGIDDAAARCEARTSEQARAECREQLSRARRKP